MLIHICTKCEREYSSKDVQDWGRTPESSGYGPTPKCVAVHEDPQTKSGAVCGGALVLIRE